MLDRRFSCLGVAACVGLVAVLGLVGFRIWSSQVSRGISTRPPDESARMIAAMRTDDRVARHIEKLRRNGLATTVPSERARRSEVLFQLCVLLSDSGTPLTGTHIYPLKGGVRAYLTGSALSALGDLAVVDPAIRARFLELEHKIDPGFRESWKVVGTRLGLIPDPAQPPNPGGP